jgi:aspartate carbamoyltransferase catalytic subunit
MRHLLDIDSLGVDGIEEVIRAADSFVEVSQRRIPKVPALQGKTVVSAFFEDSTRTRLSFEIAAARLSADVVTFSAGSSSLSKGESIRDTVETICAMNIDALIVRHQSAGVPLQIASWVPNDVSVINAGDGAHQHPSQALLDCYTIRAERKARGLRADFADLTIGMVGDVAHSRVARSNIQAWRTLGARVVVVGPPTYVPASVAAWGVEVYDDFDEVLPKLDVVYLLRVQAERIDQPLIPSVGAYVKGYGLTDARLGRLATNALIMHPGPMNRGVEITALGASHPNAVITTQVAYGVPVRMSILFLLLSNQLGSVSADSTR